MQTLAKEHNPREMLQTNKQAPSTKLMRSTKSILGECKPWPKSTGLEREKIDAKQTNKDCAWLKKRASTLGKNLGNP